ncbi:MAG: acyltransferase family protein, partial [Terriglobus roseus]|nr:acyltransferase family protein [Terriglobus roseus]
PPAYVTHGEAITLGLRDLPMHRSNSPPRAPILGVLPQLTGRDAFWACNFILALFIVSSPDAAFADTPGYRWLATLVPAHYSQKYRFLQSVGAIYLVFSISNNLHLQSLFTQPAIHYLGKISFALYLMHGMVTQTLGFAALGFFWDVTGTEPRWRKEVGFGMATALVIPATIWAADVFWRWVDVPSVRCARWVEQMCTVQDVDSHPPAHAFHGHQRQASLHKQHVQQQMHVPGAQIMETVSLNLK